MDRIKYTKPACKCVEFNVNSRILDSSNSDIENPGIGGPGEIPIE